MRPKQRAQGWPVSVRRGEHDFGGAGGAAARQDRQPDHHRNRDLRPLSHARTVPLNVPNVQHPPPSEHLCVGEPRPRAWGQAVARGPGGSRSWTGPSGRGKTSQQPRRHMHACAHLSMKGARYQQRSHRGARSSRGAAPPGGSQSQAARRRSGTTQPAGERTRSASRGSGTPRHASPSCQLRPSLPYRHPMHASMAHAVEDPLVAAMNRS